MITIFSVDLVAIEYYMEEMKSTKDEFALNSQTNSLMSFDGNYKRGFRQHF